VKEKELVQQSAAVGGRQATFGDQQIQILVNYIGRGWGHRSKILVEIAFAVAVGGSDGISVSTLRSWVSVLIHISQTGIA
jgi:hypothetical protein